MRVHVDDFETLHDFSVGVMAHAGRQANRAIFLAIIGGIVWRVHPGSVEIRFRDDNLANAALDERHRERIRLLYSRQSRQIEIHDRIERLSPLYPGLGDADC